MVLATGWLAPDGSFFECHSYDHNAEAKEIVDKIEYECTDNHYDDFLMKKGWVYIGISSYGRHEWRIGWKNFLTNAQKVFLKPYFEESHIPVIEYAVWKWESEVSE